MYSNFKTITMTILTLISLLLGLTVCFKKATKRSLLLPILLFMLFFAGKSLAATRTWDGGAGTLVWTTAANWSGDAIPVAGDDVVFNTAGTYTITGVPTLSLNSLTITSGNVTFSSSSASTLTIGGNSGTDFVISNETKEYL